MYALVMLSAVGLSAQEYRTSYDCDKAQSRVERLICTNEELAYLDIQLDKIYQDMRKQASKKKAHEMLLKQRQWLKLERNSCYDVECLKDAYKNRLEDFDPFKDNLATCAKMRKYPYFIFANAVDLGSGANSQLDVNYRCPESIASLPYMANLLNIAETIRGDEVPSPCSGTIIYAQSRYYQFSLTKAGFAPLLFLKQDNADQDPNGPNATLSPDIFYPNVLKYFQQWSDASIHNHRLYRNFFDEFNKVQPKLSAHYMKKFNFSAALSKEIAYHASMQITARAAGSYPMSAISEESSLIPLVRDKKSTKEQIKAAIDKIPVASIDPESWLEAKKHDIYQALIIALLQNRPTNYVAQFMDQLSHEDILKFESASESLLSYAIKDQKNLEYLLSKNVPVDAENDFGKTTLFYAIGTSQYQAVLALLQHKADVNHAYKSAAQLGKKQDECEYVSLRHTKRTPLMHAAQNSDKRMLALLIKHGADKSSVDELGYNALDYAMMGKIQGNIEYLKSIGMKPNVSEHSLFTR